MSDLLTSRSAIECFQECPRKRYINYCWDGIGLVPTKRYIPFATGTAVHRGIENILRHASHELKTQGSINALVNKSAIEAAIEYKNEVLEYKKKRNIANLTPEEIFTYKEQISLTEALIRVFALRVLPWMIQEYEILDVEREENQPLTDGITLMGRCDVLCRQKGSGDLHIISFKTSKEIFHRNKESGEMEVDSRRVGANEHDVQNISEPYLVSKRIGQKVMGVRMIFLIKGDNKRVDNGYITYSPLIRGYRRMGPASWEYAHSWFYPNPFNKSGMSTLGKGWQGFSVWEDMGVKKWINMLANREVQPEYTSDVLGEQIWIPSEYYLNDEETNSWVRQVTYQESRIKKILDQSIPRDRKFLDSYFPMHRKSCDYNNKCVYSDICYQEHVFNDPLNNGFEHRVPHHLMEQEKVKCLKS